MKRKKYAVFTIDVESFTDTECISNARQRVEADLLDGLDEYIALLDKHNIKGTLFAVGELAPKIADKLHSAIDKGHSLALHGHAHVPPNSMKPDEFAQKTAAAKAQLEQLFHTPIRGFRAPCFGMDRQQLDVLKELGFVYDSSFLGFQKARHAGKWNLKKEDQVRKGVYCEDGFWEFALPRQKIIGMPYPVSGGGYVRLSNWYFIKTLLRQYLRRNDYYVFYLHPFELSKEKIPVLKELKSYDKFYLQRGIAHYGTRIERIIKMLKRFGYEFVTFEELTRHLQREQGQKSAQI